MKVKQISVFLENKAGRLADATKILGEHQINIRALAVADTADFGVLRMIVNKPEEAVDVLKKEGFTVKETDVIAAEVPDKPGGLAEVLEVLRKENINIEYLYCFVEKSGGAAIVVFRIEDLDRAIDALKRAGITLLSGERLYLL